MTDGDRLGRGGRRGQMVKDDRREGGGSEGPNGLQYGVGGS